VIPAEFTDWIYDVVHLPERQPIHLFIEFGEVRADLLVIIGIVFVVAFIEHRQNGVAIPKVRWMLCNMPFHSFQDLFHGYHLQKFW
jgi:hypothetical protein